ncbi:MAG: PLDc_N domain-containing protein [Rhodococcus sp.]|nr:PLDc_N domain-containing protein [Rhodococcus sp. (in: high G+C Gram-positive bacteria)]
MPYVLFAVVTMALWIFCLVDVITRDESQLQHLPKPAWLLIVLLVPTVGSIMYLLVGREHTARPLPTTGYTEYERPGRHIAQNPEDDEEFLRKCRERAEEQRRAARRKDAEGH